MTRARLRDLDITVGHLPIGQHNAITDVPGVWVGHCTLIYDEPRIARTGVTMIVPREGAIWENYAFSWPLPRAITSPLALAPHVTEDVTSSPPQPLL